MTDTINTNGVEYTYLDKETLKSIMRSHKLAIKDKPSQYGLRASFYKMYIRDFDLTYLDLGITKFDHCILDHVKLSHSNFHSSSFADVAFRNCYISNADFSGCVFSQCSFSRMQLEDCNFRDALMCDATYEHTQYWHCNFSLARLNDTDFTNADFRACNLYRTSLNDAIFTEDLTSTGNNLFEAGLYGSTQLVNIDADRLTILPEGDIIGYKSLQFGEIAKLLIPADARRSCSTGRKCRAEFAKVLSIKDNSGEEIQFGRSRFDETVIYRPGETVRADSWDPNHWDVCSHGIHFFITELEAAMY